MYKKLIVFLMLLGIIQSSISAPTEAFFRKNKKAKQQKTEQKVEQQVERKKIMLVEIYASWCPGCKNIQPTLDQLLKDNADIELVQLDVSTPAKAKAAAKQAEDLNVIDFYSANKSKTATVAVIVTSTSEIISQFYNNNEIADYMTAIEEAKGKEQAAKLPPA